MPRLLYRSVLLVAAVFGQGCREHSHSIQCYPADGRVVYANGEPLPRVFVTLSYPEQGVCAGGMTDSDGCFALSTIELGDGAPEGTGRVIIGDCLRNYEKARIATKFNNPQSGLEFEVQRNGANHLTLVVADSGDVELQDGGFHGKQRSDENPTPESSARRVVATGNVVKK